MSSDSIPISGPRFAAALKDLSLASLHLKNLELRNSLAHLAYSNAQLRPFADGTETPLHSGGGGAAAVDNVVQEGQPDPDCVEAIRENEVVMQRLRERLALMKAEVEARGCSWREFEGSGDGDGDGSDVVVVEDDDEPGVRAGVGGGGGGGGGGSAPLINGIGVGVNGNGPETNGGANANANSSSTTARGGGGGGNPWTDGTFQTGVVRNGEIHMDAVPGRSAGGVGGAVAASSTATSNAAPTGSGVAGGRLTDEELRRLLEERLAEDGGDDEDGGLHL